MNVRSQAVTVLVAAVGLGAVAFPASAAVARDQGASPTSRADTIEGTQQADILDGKAGHDTIDGGGGADTIVGGPGRDFIRGGGGNDTIDARDGYVDAVHCGNGRDTVTADEKDAVSETCEDVSPPPEDDRTATLAVRLQEDGLTRLPPGYRYGLIEIHMESWLPGFTYTYCRPPCSYQGSAKPPNTVYFRKPPSYLGAREFPDFKFGVLSMGDCWKHQGPDRFNGSCTLEMDRDRVVLVQVWPCETIARSWPGREIACPD